MIVVKRYMGGYPQTKIDFYNRYVYQKDMRGGQSMSLYNMVNGFNPACIFIMPLLGRIPPPFLSEAKVVDECRFLLKLLTISKM